MRGKPARSRRGRRSVDAGWNTGRALGCRAVRRKRIEDVLARDRVGLASVEIPAIARPVNRSDDHVIAETDIDSKTIRRFDLILDVERVDPAAVCHLVDIPIARFGRNTEQQGCPAISAYTLICSKTRSLRGLKTHAGVCDRRSEVVGLNIDASFERVPAQDFRECAAELPVIRQAAPLQLRAIQPYITGR